MLNAFFGYVKSAKYICHRQEIPKSNAFCPKRYIPASFEFRKSFPCRQYYGSSLNLCFDHFKSTRRLIP